MMVKRIYVEKKKGFDIEAAALCEDLKESLHLRGLTGVRIFNRYDMEGVDDSTYKAAKFSVFAEPAVDVAYDEMLDIFKPADSESDKNMSVRYFAVEYLPGQFDQRADSAAQCIQMISMKEKPEVRFARVICLEGDISDDQFEAVRKYCVNPVDSHEAEIEKPAGLAMEMAYPPDVETIRGFMNMNDDEVADFRDSQQFAMSLADIKYVRDYFKNEEFRDPTASELKVIDTYWSDHCRHTTFLTAIREVRIGDGRYEALFRSAYEEYFRIRKELYGTVARDVTLMDLAVIGAKYMKAKGRLSDLDESEEINACSIKVKATVKGEEEDWLVMFKNETHNHPTEIEPFGGAATCLGGAIRDPLSGRVYVYQAMRVTGSGDPRAAIEKTLPGKLPQRKITREAAAGYSSYGNQIGLATGQVSEIYHEGYVAKRMEVGAVIGAAPAANIYREKPGTGDRVVLVGGRTGRDGCGGATGSSKEHTEESILTCGAEVQKGNPPVERNIQRLFRRSEATLLIKKCNDFGAGGVSVAIGELADSLDIDLDLVRKKYEGLDGTELAISESQERMAVVVAEGDLEKFEAYAAEENLEAVAVAKVTDTGRLRMFWRGKCILDISRQFLDTNGVKQETKAVLAGDAPDDIFDAKSPADKEMSLREQWFTMLTSLTCASQKGLVERFDSTIGAGTILMPLGGKYQLTPAMGMAAKLPALTGDTETATLMAYGFDPILSEKSPFHGALYAVVDSVTKIVAMGGDPFKVRLSFQEYFEKLGSDPVKWGKPFAALLGALKAQKELEIAAIGGKDSMSGTFNELHVPPTLISFAVAPVLADEVISPEIKRPGNRLALLQARYDKDDAIDFIQYKKNMSKVRKMAEKGLILSASTIGRGGIAGAVSKMAFGNKIGVALENIAREDLFKPMYGAMILELDREANLDQLFVGIDFKAIGKTIEERTIKVLGNEFDMERMIRDWKKPLEAIFPTRTAGETPAAPEAFGFGNLVTQEQLIPLDENEIQTINYFERNPARPAVKIAVPKVTILTFPGTNCEVDSRRAFEKAGADAETMIFRNLTTAELEESIREMARMIRRSQIVMIPGGFSGGDEPDGSAKFITAVFRNPMIREAVADLLENRDGLMLGICNGFQALIKLGLVPYGRIVDQDEDSPTLTYNSIGRHVSCLVRTRVASVKSPWFSRIKVGDVHTIPVSHGEGRFIASGAQISMLARAGQIAAQYVDHSGEPSMAIEANPNNSVWAVEALTSPDGRVLGKMAHSERIGRNLYKNVPGDTDQKLFEAGVSYFK